MRIWVWLSKYLNVKYLDLAGFKNLSGLVTNRLKISTHF